MESGGAGWAGAGPGTDAGDSLVRPDSIVGRERAASDAEDAFTKALRESFISFIAVLLNMCSHKDSN